MSCSSGDNNENNAISDVTLSSVNIAGKTIELEENKTGNYEIPLENNQRSVDITARTNLETMELSYFFGFYDGSEDAKSIESGEAFSMDLDEGNNILSIIVSDPETEKWVVYNFILYRTSSEVGLSNYALYTEKDNETSAIAFNPSFDPDVYEYTANVDNDICHLFGQFYTKISDNRAELNGTELESAEIFYQTLEAGENILDIFVNSGQGLRTVRYSVNINRAAPTEEQIQSNSRLANLHIEGADIEFLCSQNAYAVTINNDAKSLFITADAEIDGIEMVIDDIDLENGNTMEIPISETDTQLTLTTQSLDGSSSANYTIYINRLNTNRVEVDTSEALQFALQNANPSDEIVLAPGIYTGLPGTGLPGIASSGHDSAAFFSQRSGTHLNPIYLRAEDPEEDTVLLGDLTKGIDAFRLGGDYWQISGISFGSAKTALFIDGGKNNRFYNTEVKDSEQALFIEEGSANNEFYGSEFIAIDTTDSELAFIEDKNSTNPGNQYRRNLIKNNAYIPALSYTGNNPGLVVEANRLETYGSDKTSVPQITSAASNATFRFNTFYPYSGNSLAAFIEVESTNDESPLRAADNVVYQNWLVEPHEDQVMLTSNTATNLQAMENYFVPDKFDDDSYEEAKHTGSAVNIDTFNPPRYNIQVANAPDMCLGLEQEDDAYFVVIQDCSDAVEQIWSLEIADDYFVYLRNESLEEDNYLMPNIGFTSYCESIENASGLTYLSKKIYGYSQQWAMLNTMEGETIFYNRQNTAYGLTVKGNTYTPETPTAACPITDSERQKFKLIELVN